MGRSPGADPEGDDGDHARSGLGSTPDLELTTALEVTEAVAATHRWFEQHSGWAPPDPDTLVEWLADGVCRAPDDCLVAPDGRCRHGLASWKLVLDALDR